VNDEQLRDLRLQMLQQLEQSHQQVRQLVSGLVDLTLLLPTLDFGDDAQADKAMRLAADVMTGGEDMSGVAGRISWSITYARQAAKALAKAGAAQ